MCKSFIGFAAAALMLAGCGSDASPNSEPSISVSTDRLSYIVGGSPAITVTASAPTAHAQVTLEIIDTHSGSIVLSEQRPLASHPETFVLAVPAPSAYLANARVLDPAGVELAVTRAMFGIRPEDAPLPETVLTFHVIDERSVLLPMVAAAATAGSNFVLDVGDELLAVAPTAVQFVEPDLSNPSARLS